MVNITITTANKLPGTDNLFINIGSYRKDLVDIIRSFPNKNFNAKNNTWELPLTYLKDLIKRMQPVDDITIYYSYQAEELKHIPTDYKFKTTPFKHQLDAIEYGLNHSCWILADEPGLGKTKTACDLASILNSEGEVSQCLIICGVNGLKYNWANEIKIHTNKDCFILGTRYRKNGNEYIGSTQDKIDDVSTHSEFFLITNVETLRNKDFVAAVNRKCNIISMIVVDEAHKCNNSTSQQGKNLQKLNKEKYRIALTGTPILNNPLDAYASLKWIGAEHSNLTQFRQFYCEFGGFGGYEVIRYKNIDVLKNSFEKYMLRRKKEDVLDLPEKLYRNEYVEMNEKQRGIYEEARKWVLENIDMIKQSPNPLSQLLRMRQATGATSILSSEINESCKLDRLEELVDEISRNDKKCIVFSNWTSMTDLIVQRLKKYNPAVITGEVDSNTRNEERDRFQNDKNCKVCVGTIGALGTGFTLTAATYAIFTDLPWNKGTLTQCEDRIHRISTKENVTIIKLICKNTIDEKINQLVEDKGTMSDYIIDDKPLDKEKVLNFLLE